MIKNSWKPLSQLKKDEKVENITEGREE